MKIGRGDIGNKPLHALVKNMLDPLMSNELKGDQGNDDPMQKNLGFGIGARRRHRNISPGRTNVYTINIGPGGDK